jgi:hypothetical protein
MSMKIKLSEKPGKTDGTRETQIKEEMELDMEILEPTNECQSTSWVYWRRDAQKLQIWKEGKTHSNKRCIPAVLSCFDKVTANHKITSFKTTDSAVLHNWPIQFDDWLNGTLLDIEARC